jgi:hypothetical protein
MLFSSPPYKPVNKATSRFDSCQLYQVKEVLLCLWGAMCERCACLKLERMNKEEIIYKMACKFGHAAHSEIGSIDYKFWEDVSGEDIAKELAGIIEKQHQEFQKQIEAVKGLIVAREHFMGCKDADMIDDIHDQLENMEIALTENLRTLTQTLKPYLNGEKLEV